MSNSFDLKNNYFLNDKCIASALTQTDGVLSDFLVPSLKLVRGTTESLAAGIKALSNDIYLNVDEFGNRGLSGKVEFLLSAGRDSMEYRGDVASYSTPDHSDQNLTSFLAYNFGENAFLKRGFCFRLSCVQDFYKAGVKVFSFGENDYFIINNNCTAKTAVSSDIRVIRDAKNEAIDISSDLSSIREELHSQYFKLSANNRISGDNAFVGIQNIKDARIDNAGISAAIISALTADYTVVSDISAVSLSADASRIFIDGEKTLFDLSDDFQTQILNNDNDISFLSHAISSEELRNKLHVAYMGDMTLSDHYPDPDHESEYIKNTLAGMLYTNSFIREDRSRKIRRGFMFRASGCDLSSYTISSDADGGVRTVHDNDMLLFNQDVQEISSVCVSSVEVIKDYDLDVSRLHYTLSGAVYVKDLAAGESKTIEQIAKDFADTYGKDHWNVGDIIIVKTPLYETAVTYSYTGYVWDGSVWRAMDGNYSAENVFFTKDFQLDGDYSAIGNIKKDSKTINSKGMSVQQLFEDMFNTTVLPTLGTNPSYTITLTNAGKYEVGKPISATFKVTYIQGNYKYPWRTSSPTEADGTSFASMVVTDGTADTLTITKIGEYAFPKQITVESSTNYKLKATNVNYSDGKIPVNSKGAEVPDVQRKAGTLADATTAGSITGYYGYFYGYKTGTDKLDDPTVITSNEIRGLQSTKSGVAAQSFGQLETTNMQQIYCACLSSFIGSKKMYITDTATGASAGEVKGPIEKKVKDAGGRDQVYGLYYVDNSSAAAGSAKWNIELK